MILIYDSLHHIDIICSLQWARRERDLLAAAGDANKGISRSRLLFPWWYFFYFYLFLKSKEEVIIKNS
jgi:hypothetical protein